MNGSLSVSAFCEVCSARTHKIHSRTHNKTRTTRYRSESHYHYSYDLVHLFQT